MPVADRRRSPALTVREIVSVNDPAFRPAFALLKSAFSRAEMLPLADWRNAMRERAHGLWTDISWHLIVAERRGKLVAAATGSYLGNVNAGIIGYIAVDPHARATGVGPRMRRALRARFSTDARRSGWPALGALVGEVRADNPWLRHLIRHEGAIALDFPYYQPSLGGSRKAVELVLYYQPLDHARKSVGAGEVRRLLYTMWRRVYRIARPLSRPEFRQMMRALQKRQRIGQRRPAVHPGR